MSSLNTKTAGSVSQPRLAAGTGNIAALLPPIQTLRRMCSALLLWEGTAYAGGDEVTSEIAKIIPQCDPREVSKFAVELRKDQQLRHAPLFILRELFREPASRAYAGEALVQVIQRPDELTEFLAIYWKDGKVPLANQVKKALGNSLSKFNEYQLAKYKDQDKEISLRDVMHLVHAKPSDLPPERKGLKWDKHGRREARRAGIKLQTLTPKETLFQNLSNKELATPETREVLLSGARTPDEKRQVYTKLLEENKLGADALLKNLSGMTLLGVDQALINAALTKANPSRLLPLQFFAAFRHAPQFQASLEVLMKKCLSRFSKLKGHSILVLDVSGSMHRPISGKSAFTRQDAAVAMAIMAKVMCKESTIYLTAGSDEKGVHTTAKLRSTFSGLGLIEDVATQARGMGYGGIYTRQALEFIKEDWGDAPQPERIIVFSDSQDMEAHPVLGGRRRSTQPVLPPQPFGKYNYIADVSCEKYGINYKGVWTQEVSGWSQMFLEYIAQCEQGYQAKLF